MTVHLYTDGSLMPGNHGGWSVTVVTPDGGERNYSGTIRTSSPQDTELAAVAFALMLVREPSHVVVHTDHDGNRKAMQAMLATGETPRRGDPALWEAIREQAGRHLSVAVESVRWADRCEAHRHAHRGSRDAARRSMGEGRGL